MASPGLSLVATMERTIGAPLVRVWENVRDWEHLPWLHREAFSSIDVGDSGDWGWKARVRTRARPDEDLDIELIIHEDDLRYVTQTVGGRGRGTEIWTELESRGDATAIRVEFWLPDVPESLQASVGRGYVDLYQRLWDEDEEMMRQRGARLSEGQARGEAVVDLGPEPALRSRLPLVVESQGDRWRIVDVDGSLHVHSTRCPHMLGPLGDADLSDLPEHEVRCPWHGYRFDVRSGRSCDGRTLRLRRPPRIEVAPGGSAVRLHFQGP